MNNNKYRFSLLLAVAILLSPAFGADDSGLIIPMPGKKQIKKAKEKLSKKAEEKKQKKTSNGTLIPLPTTIKPTPQKPKESKVSDPTDTQNSSKPENQPLIIIRPTPQPSQQQDVQDSGSDFPTIPDEVVIEPDSLSPVENLPSGSPQAGGSGDASPSSLPMYPKDTSSAVFMVMKTWQCQDYDGNTLLSHAVSVYSEEAGDSFSIAGLSEDQAFKLDLDEEDITLDELLDLIALKTGRDWGVDIPGKTIYFYPKGVKTDSLSSW
jgi:hypothetical protein